MALIKIQRFFGAVPNELLNNPEISFKAKGLYAYLNSKPDNWDFSVERISHQAKEGIDSVRGAIHELEQFGYLVRRKHQDEKGFWEIDYILYETPTEEKTYLGKSNEGKPIEQSKKEITKKEYTKKEKEIDERGLSEAVELWLQYKRERKQSYKGVSSIQAMVNKLYDLSTGDEEIAIKIVQHCMASNYSGLFPLPIERVNKYSAAPSVRPAVNTSAMMNQDNHSNYADYLVWCKKNNVSPEPESI